MVLFTISSLRGLSWPQIYRMQSENADGIREQVARDVAKLDHRLSDVENKMKQNNDDLDHKLQSVSLLWIIDLKFLLFSVFFFPSVSSISSVLNCVVCFSSYFFFLLCFVVTVHHFHFVTNSLFSFCFLFVLFLHHFLLVLSYFFSYSK